MDFDVYHRNKILLDVNDHQVIAGNVYKVALLNTKQQFVFLLMVIADSSSWIEL